MAEGMKGYPEFDIRPDIKGWCVIWPISDGYFMYVKFDTRDECSAFVRGYEDAFLEVVNG